VIIRDILKNEVKMRNPYCRIVLGMASMDTLISFGIFLTTWAIPIDGLDTDLQAPYRSGNTNTCIFQGMLLQFTLASNIYNLCLAIYYFLSITTKYSEEEMRKIERMMHAAALTFGFGTSIAGIPLKLYNSAGPWCWISSLPFSCGLSSESDPSTCLRGKYAYAYRIAFLYGPLWVIILSITIIMIRIACHVRKRERLVAQYRFSQRGRGHLTRQVARHGFLYVVALYISIGPGTLSRLFETFNYEPPFVLMLLSVIFAPSQGFFNCFIYFKPKYGFLGCHFGSRISSFFTKNVNIDLIDPTAMLRQQQLEDNNRSDSDSLDSAADMPEQKDKIFK